MQNEASDDGLPMITSEELHDVFLSLMRELPKRPPNDPVAVANVTNWELFLLLCRLMRYELQARDDAG